MIGAAVVEFGLSVDAAWRLTPREFAWLEQSATKRVQRERNLLIAAAWTNAALQRHKKLPKLDTLLRTATRPRKRAQPHAAKALFEYLLATKDQR